jgi:hypothetical protein
MMVNGFIEKQLEMSQRMLDMMARDHKHRLEQLCVWTDMNDSLMKKLEARDKEISRLNALLRAYETMEKL